MFFSIPSSNDEIITVTPIGAKCVKSLFFENKNGHIFNYNGQLDTVSISIDGKQIARQLPVAPFATTTPFGAGRFDWEKVALAVNLNVDNSEIKISGSFNNQYNIVFVCDTKPISETGFDYVETRRFVLKDALSVAEAKNKILANLSANYTTIYSTIGQYADDDVVVPIFDYDEADGTYQRHKCGVTKKELWTNLNAQPYSTYAAWETAELEARAAILLSVATRISNMSAITLAAGVFNQAQNIVLDSSPEKVVAYSFVTPYNKAEGVTPIQLNRINLQADLNISDNENLPAGFDLGLISISNRVPFADAVHSFSSKTATNKYGQITLRIAGNQSLFKASQDASIGDWQLYMMFIYSKLA